MNSTTDNRIDALFARKKHEVLSIYMTAGYPRLEDTVPVLEALESGGADLVEIGMPFSDPLADGPVIQQSSQKALENGMSIRVLFEQLEAVRETVQIPLVLMGYLNPVLQFGMEEFLAACSRVGVDGLILPDLPADEYESEYRDLFDSHGIRNILLITPQTGEDRVRRLSRLSGGFLYMVADAGTTGARSRVENHQLDYFRRTEALDLGIPRLVGFGISNRDTFLAACEFGQGAIIGSAFIQSLSRVEGDPRSAVSDFLKGILEEAP